MQSITVVELKNKLDNNEDFLLLDVREEWEYNEANINAKWLTLSRIQDGDFHEIMEWKNREVIIHCRSGVRSALACDILENYGFQNVKNLVGGILAWSGTYGLS